MRHSFFAELERWSVASVGRLPVISPISFLLNAWLRLSAASGLGLLGLARRASRQRRSRPQTQRHR